MKNRGNRAITKAQAIIVGIVVVVGAVGVGYFATIAPSATTTTTTTTLPVAQTSVITPRKGGLLPGEPAYYDVIRAEITKQNGKFSFVVEVAAPVPEKPTLPSGVVELHWWFHIYSGEVAGDPRGYPLAPGEIIHGELWVMVVWNGEKFEGLLIDRRPLLEGQEAIIVPVPFSIEGANLKLFVDLSRVNVEMPSRFGWEIHIVGLERPRGVATLADIAVLDLGGAALFP